MKTKITILLLLISLSVSAQKYALWQTKTKTYVNVKVDSFSYVHRANFSYYIAHCGKMEISMFTKHGDSVKGWIKKRI